MRQERREMKKTIFYVSYLIEGHFFCFILYALWISTLPRVIYSGCMDYKFVEFDVVYLIMLFFILGSLLLLSLIKFFLKKNLINARSAFFIGVLFVNTIMVYQGSLPENNRKIYFYRPDGIYDKEVLPVPGDGTQVPELTVPTYAGFIIGQHVLKTVGVNTGGSLPEDSNFITSFGLDGVIDREQNNPIGGPTGHDQQCLPSQ
jgi:hypothetical protein